MRSNDYNENAVPAFKADVTETEKGMALVDKLKLIDIEVRQLYEFCVKAGYSPAQIEKYAEPLLTVQTSEKKKKWFKRLWFLIAVVAFIAFIFYYDPAYRQVCIYSKLASVKVLPFWDWTFWYEEDCFVNNPYKIEERLSEKDCETTCKGWKGIETLVEADPQTITDLLFKNTPVIVSDATEDWKARVDFSVAFLAKLFQQNNHLKETKVCQFQSTIPEYEHPSDFLANVISGEIKETYQTYWENCDKESAKVLRQFYRRPYFLPPMVESSEGNWMIVSSGGTQSLKVSWSATVTWLSQITGRSRITLKPEDVCEGICQPMRVELQTGHSILFSNDMWTMSYKPVGDDPVIAIGSTGNFDNL